MEIFGNIFNTVFFAPIVNLLVFIWRLLEASNIPGSIGWSIIGLTVVIRALVWPFMAAQLKSAQKMQQLKPHMDALKKKHDKDKQALALAQAALFKEHNYNPAAGCVPALLQIPVFIALYNAISSLFNNQAGLDHINYFLYNQAWRLTESPDPYWLGLNLAIKPMDSWNSVWLAAILIPVITGVLQFVQSKMMMPATEKAAVSTVVKGQKKEEPSTEDTMATVQSQMVFIMPVMIGYFAYTFPIGLALYWNMFSILGIYQQYLIGGWGGLRPWLEKAKLIK